MGCKPIPDGYHAVTPYLVVSGVSKVVDFLQNAFDAKMVGEPMKGPDGAIRHAEVQIGDSKLMLGEACEKNAPMPSMFYLYVEDCDKAYEKAIKAGGKSVREPETQFYGDRSGGVEDSAGNQWWVGSRVEEVSPEEMKKRMAEKYQEKAGAKA